MTGFSCRCGRADPSTRRRNVEIERERGGAPRNLRQG